MATEAGHHSSDIYRDQSGDLHLGGGRLFDQGEHALAERITMTAAAGAANITEVTITVKDGGGNTLARVHQLDLWLSDDVDGEGHTTATASGTVTNKAASGLVVATQVAKKALTVQTLKTGIFILEITDTAKTLFKVCARAPGTGRSIVGITLLTASYG